MGRYTALREGTRIVLAGLRIHRVELGCAELLLQAAPGYEVGMYSQVETVSRWRILLVEN